MTARYYRKNTINNRIIIIIRCRVIGKNNAWRNVLREKKNTLYIYIDLRLTRFICVSQ